jgi:hypothetical protein
VDDREYCEGRQPAVMEDGGLVTGATCAISVERIPSGTALSLYACLSIRDTKSCARFDHVLP